MTASGGGDETDPDVRELRRLTGTVIHLKRRATQFLQTGGPMHNLLPYTLKQRATPYPHSIAVFGQFPGRRLGLEVCK